MTTKMMSAPAATAVAVRPLSLKCVGTCPARFLRSRNKALGICLRCSAGAGAAGAGAGDTGSSNNSSSSSAGSGAAARSEGAGPSGWWKRLFGSSKLDKQKLAEYGLGAFAAYGILSNLNAGVLVTIAWLAVVKQTGLTPIDPGQWPKFLAVYAGLYITTNLLRPVRLTLALAAAPFFNTALERIQSTLRVNKAVAFGIMLAGIAITSFTCIGSAIALCGGFPNGLPPVPWKR
ncbi:hypothetical protein COO60DRAFT_1709441 [Scenedesmus sp. NREL 46B-D3]|nr:hypothetical protein COO60DRAFT_1709441 [Scenedesmus sp. NREL 46B-D3]